MARDAAARRGDLPTVFLSLVEDPKATEVADWVRGLLPTRPGQLDAPAELLP
jgi:urease accessory protein